jgi:transposase
MRGCEQAGLSVELLETRHVRNAFKIMPVKTDRKDARGIAELIRLGWFRPDLRRKPMRRAQAPSRMAPVA